MIGIYKITSPSGRIYIGQSVNIEKRLASYRHSLAEKQPKLNRSFKKYGVYRHEFEIIHECPIEKLNAAECFWIYFYDSAEDGGLNCDSANVYGFRSNFYMSQETKDKISKTKTGKESKLKGISIGLGRKHTIYSTINLVLNTETGIYYNSISSAAIAHNIKVGTLRHYLKPRRIFKNKRAFKPFILLS